MSTAIIWDCDGVLVDSERLSCAAWLPTLRRHGIAVELADIEAFIGRADIVLLEHYRRAGYALPTAALQEREEEYFRTARGTLRSFDGLRAVLDDLHEEGIPVAVASSGQPDRIRFSVEEVGIAGYFDILCSAAEVEHGKPAPDLFLLAAERLEQDPTGCIVIEDSVPGIEAARAAGMRAFGFTSSHSPQVLKKAGAHMTFDAYPQLREALSAHLQRTKTMR